MTNPPTTPRGRDAVQAALLDAAAICFAERGIAATSVREIATKAQVNHGLVHRHFGSKDGLLTELLKRLSAQVNLRLDEALGLHSTPSPDKLIPHIFMGTASSNRHWRVVLHAMLEGIPPYQLQTDFPVFRRLVSSYRQVGYPEDEALAEAALTFSTGLGFLTFKGYLECAVEQEGAQWETLRPMLMKRFLSRFQQDN
mgnify:CR=1 FL=1